MQVADRACRVVLDDKFFRRSAAHGLREHAEHLAVRNVIVVVVGSVHGVARSLTARDYRHLLHGVATLGAARDDGVTRFVIGGNALIDGRDKPRFLLRSHDDLIDALEHILHGYARAVVARGEDCRFVQKVFYVRARKAARNARYRLEIYVRRERFIARVHL